MWHVSQERLRRSSSGLLLNEEDYRQAWIDLLTYSLFVAFLTAAVMFENKEAKANFRAEVGEEPHFLLP